MTPPSRLHAEAIQSPLSSGAVHTDKPGRRHDGTDRPPVDVALRRRISYFMLFRLGVLAAFTVLAAVTSYLGNGAPERIFEWLTWSSLALGFSITLIFAWRLPSVVNLGGFAQFQTAIDLVLSAVVVQLTSGADSRFTFLYLIAILGAATMGDRRQIWVASGAAFLIYAFMSFLQATDIVIPLAPSGALVQLQPLDLALTVARTSAAMAGIAALSAYLNSQLLSSVSQLGSLRALNEDIVRSLSSGLITVNMEGKVLFANPTACEMLALREEPTGLEIGQVLPGIESHLDAPGGPQNRFEIELSQRDHRALRLGLSCCPLRDSGSRQLGHVINFQDVTELRKLAQLVTRNERLAAIGKLAASVAHEVRNPLAAIAGSAELLSDASLGDEDSRLLGVIRRESSRLNHTVSDLLAFTRSGPTSKVEVELAMLIADVADAFRADPNNKEVDISLHCAGPIPVLGDRGQLSQILWNLLRNAVESMQGSGSIELGASIVGERAQILVHDEGPGIDPDHMERIFEPMFSTKDQGSGFGLATVHRIVEEHDGTIAADSAVRGRGASFTVHLPLHQRNIGNSSAVTQPL
ncbi:MAG: ATP-binding protein [Nannocystaceae bacterium]